MNWTEIYKIEGLVGGQWDPAAVGHPADNCFDTEEEAEAAIPQLARIFGCSETEFRVIVAP